MSVAIVTVAISNTSIQCCHVFYGKAQPECCQTHAQIWSVVTIFIFLINMLIVACHGATDVTGFGILGHLRNLAGNQKQDVSFCLHSLPGMTVQVGGIQSMYAALFAVLGGMFAVAEAAAEGEGGINFKLKEGFSAETSGLLMLGLNQTPSAFTHFSGT